MCNIKEKSDFDLKMRHLDYAWFESLKEFCFWDVTLCS